MNERVPQAVQDAPGMLRAKLTEQQTSSGSGNNYATVLVVVEHAERAAFARTSSRSFVASADRVARALRAAIDGNLRRAR